MKTLLTVCAGMGLMLAASLQAESWSYEIDYVDSCACNIICPCLFGSDPTNRECLGQGYFKVTKGHYGDVDLTGVVAHHAYKMGSWERYTVAEGATAEQVAALRKVIEASLALPGSEIVSYEQGPVTYEEKDGHILISAPNSSLEIEPVPGRDGEPLRIDNHPVMLGYEQYRAVFNVHNSESADFSLVGTNGLTANRMAGSGG